MDHARQSARLATSEDTEIRNPAGLKEHNTTPRIPHGAEERLLATFQHVEYPPV